MVSDTACEVPSHYYGGFYTKAMREAVWTVIGYEARSGMLQGLLYI